VTDLAAASAAFEARYGLTTVEGGRHPDWGTANRIVPLGATYVEIVAVVEDGQARKSTFGRWIQEDATNDGHLLGWAVRTENLGDVARRLDLTTDSGSRRRADGTLLRWRYAGIAEAAADPSLPFFIEWDPGSALPGRAATSPQPTIAKVGLRGHPDKLSAWLGEHALPIEIEPGRPALTSVTVTNRRGRKIVINLS